MSSRFRALAWLAIPSLLAVTILEVPAADAASTLNYASLGDSYSAGVGAPGGSGPCVRSPNGYAGLWAAANTPASFQFVACAGAVVEDVLANQLSVLNANTNLVSLTVGGNDVGFFPVVALCALDSNDVCEQRVTDARTAISSILPAKLNTVYQAIRRAAPSAKVVVLGYPRLFDPLADCPEDGMTTFKRMILNTAADQLDRLIADRAGAAGFIFEDVRPAFDGHAACVPGAWINNFSLDATTGPLHPNALGYSQGYLPAMRAGVAATAPPPSSPPPTTPPPTTPPTPPPPTTPPPTTPPPAVAFRGNENWITNPYFGDHAPFGAFADVTGDGKADAVVVNNSGISVRRSTGNSFSGPEAWTTNPYFGERLTTFADVTGDGKADAVVVNNSGVTVRPSTGSSFGAPATWISVPYFGDRLTAFADVTGDGRADAIAVNSTGSAIGITVRRSTGSTFGAPETWFSSAFFGDRLTDFADVTGDGRADAIAVNSTGIMVRPSIGSAFGILETWSTSAFFGARLTDFVDVTGDGRADAVAVNSTGITVRPSTSAAFDAAQAWTNDPYFGNRAPYNALADVTGDRRADAIVVNNSGVTVRRVG